MPKEQHVRAELFDVFVQQLPLVPDVQEPEAQLSFLKLGAVNQHVQEVQEVLEAEVHRALRDDAEEPLAQKGGVGHSQDPEAVAEALIVHFLAVRHLVKAFLDQRHFALAKQYFTDLGDRGVVFVVSSSNSLAFGLP